MGFTTPCFIRKNTPEIKKKLEELGYKPFGSVKYEWDMGLGLSTDNRLGEFESFDNNSLENIIKCESPDYEYSIDCGDNEELFLAIAALRDDTDYMQWFMIPNTKTVPVPGYCGQQGMAGYQRIVTSVEYHKYDRKDSRITDLINFEKEDGETILPRKLNIEELKLWFNHKIMHNDYKDDPVIKEYAVGIRDNITDKKKRDCSGNKKVFSKRK